MSHPKPEEKQQVEQLRTEHGLVGAAKLLGINAQTLNRALFGLYVRPSSVRKLREGLAKTSNSPKP